MNLVEFLHISAARHADRPAVTDVRSRRSLTYRELGPESDRVAAFLAQQGVARGQRIGLLAPNGIDYLPAAFGLLASGACLIPLATNLAPPEMARILREVDVNGCLVAPGMNGLGGADDKTTLTAGACAGYTFQWTNRGAEGAPGLRALNPAFIRFTSGTTASSKGVVLTHEATAARIEAADRVLKLSEDDRILWVLPLAYHFAVTIVAYVKAGAHMLMCPDTLPGTLVESINRHRASVLYASPLHFERLGGLAGTPLPSVRFVLSTSAPITAAVMDRFEAVYGVPVGQAYGIIEAGLPCINLRSDGVPAASVGRPVPGYDVAVFSDEGQRLPADALGEIGVKGAGLFSAYYAPWLLREHLTRDGWFMTGDIGWLDEGGALHLKGRKKAVIFVAGLKFFPEEVEEVLNEFPGVRESRVFGRPHPHLGEVHCAEIVPASAGCDLEALKAHCARALSSYKVPVEFTVVEAIPRTPGGKILRRPATVSS
jgi:long-chain acyl-CoA synthetase